MIKTILVDLSLILFESLIIKKWHLKSCFLHSTFRVQLKYVLMIFDLFYSIKKNLMIIIN